MKLYTFQVKANEASSFGIVGDYIHIFSAIGDLTVKTNIGDTIVLPELLGWRCDKIFETITITSTVDQVIKFYAGFGKIIDNRTIIVHDIDISAGTEIISGIFSAWAASSSISAVKVLDSDPGCKAIYFTNASPGIMAIGGSALMIPIYGLQLLPGKTIKIEQGAKAPWYAVCQVISGDSTESYPNYSLLTVKIR